ncbi:unnamed protein product [Mytilus coruscus]|uniref:Sushi domain-containing protein n=1 Tax=Mytilus coruscus TaxID=42192 RepID=A0A6J8D1P1_MYTCO|nr:unnamed protein product [Mytilus coruscus]
MPNCGHPPKVANASWLPGVESNGQTTILMCNDGFYKYDIVPINCTTNNTWTGFEGGFCFQGSVKTHLMKVENGQLKGAEMVQITVLSCNPGFSSSLTSVTIQCNLNGQWEQANDSCTLETTTSYESSTEYIGSTVVNMSTSREKQTSAPQAPREQTSTQLTTYKTTTTSQTTFVPTTILSTDPEPDTTHSTSTAQAGSDLDTREQTSTQLTTNETITTFPPTAVPSRTLSTNHGIKQYSFNINRTNKYPFRTSKTTTTFQPTTVATTTFSKTMGSGTTLSTSTAQTSSDLAIREQTSTELIKDETITNFSTTAVPTSTFQQPWNQAAPFQQQTSTSPLTTKRITTTPPTTVSTTSKEPKNSLSTTVEQSDTTVTIREETVSILTTIDTIIKFPTKTGFISSLPTSTKTGFRRSTQTSLISTNPVSPDSKGKYASDDDTGNKLTLTITIVSSVVGVLILITIVSIFVACLYRKKKVWNSTNGSMHRSTNMHSDSCSNDSNGWDSFHRNSGPPLYRRSWTFDHKNAFPSFRNLSYLQKDQTDSTEKIDNYHV